MPPTSLAAHLYPDNTTMQVLLKKWWRKITGTENSNPTIYYISGDGSDSNIGTHPMQAWKSIKRLNQAKNKIRAKDQILFKRGYCYTGRPFYLDHPHHENQIGAYGSGKHPVFPQIENLNKSG